MRHAAKSYSQDELDAAQDRFGLCFPADLIAALREGRLAAGYDWRRDFAEIERMLAWPLEGLLFDVEANALWLPEWGERPGSAREREAVVTDLVAKAPRLIPLYAHRYLPEEPHAPGNPVLSVYQSDIIYYGASLDDYLAMEFGGVRRGSPVETPRHIRFWSDLLD